MLCDAYILTTYILSVMHDQLHYNLATLTWTNRAAKQALALSGGWKSFGCYAA